MNADRIYETETMAELCARQGRLGDAIDIYRRLSDVVTDVALQARFRRRLSSLEARWQAPGAKEVPPADLPLPRTPGVTLLMGDEQLTVAWSLPLETVAPSLDLLLLQRTPAGIETTKRTMPLTATSGRIGLLAPALHSAVAAAGTLVDGRFVAIARSRA
jgi:hypothetical protein